MEDLPAEVNPTDEEINCDFTDLQKSCKKSDILRCPVSNLKDSGDVSSDDGDAPGKRFKRFKPLSDSESDSDKDKCGDLNGAKVKSLLPQSTLLVNNSDKKSSAYKNTSCNSSSKMKRNLSYSDESEIEVPNKSNLQDSESDENDSTTSESQKTKNKNVLNSENEKPQQHNSQIHSTDSEDEDDTSHMSKGITKSRIQSKWNLSDSSKSGSDNAIKNKAQQIRMKNKRNKIRDKFKNLVTTRGKEQSSANIIDHVNENSDSDSSTTSHEDMASIEKIKQIIKEKMIFKPSICDPDTSDEENAPQKPVYKQKKERKMTKSTSPKPQRMSAKQAMENMQKIKSESNRMLREKEVSLPYHRPKALSLKDIMSRRKLAVSADGKALPIKMNEDQLKHYAHMLEERQKEMMELCKSESEEEAEEEKNNENPGEVNKDTAVNKVNDTIIDNGNEGIDAASDNIIQDTNSDNNLIEVNDTSSNNNIRTSIENANRDNALGNNVDGNSVQNDTQDEPTKDTITFGIDPDHSTKEQDSESSMELVYNDSANSIVDDKLTADTKETATSISEIVNEKKVDAESTNTNKGEISENKENHTDSSKPNTESDSQHISLHFDTENSIAKELSEDDMNKNNTVTELPNTTSKTVTDNIAVSETTNFENKVTDQDVEIMELDNEFSDDDLNMADIDNIIENAEIIKDIEDKVNSQFLVRDKPLNLNPKLTGAPGMVIDLDTENAAPRKSGVELLKERFTYFAKLKTPEEIKRERDKKLKPGTQLKKLKLELEEKMTEQRSLEWAKRLEDEKQQQMELKVLRGEESDEDDIDKIEAGIEDNDEEKEESEKSESEGEEEPIENDVEITDKPRKTNALLDDEAEETDCDEQGNNVDEDVEQNNENDDDGIQGADDDDDESESDESSESEEEEQALKTKKGRILKAFEDSDEEETAANMREPVVGIMEVKKTIESKSASSVVDNCVGSQILSQDEELQLAQRHKMNSEDLFTSQESAMLVSEAKANSKNIQESDEAFTQTFSILESSKLVSSEVELNSSDKLSVLCSTQSLEVSNLGDASGIYPVTDTQINLPLPSQIPTTQLSQSQPIGEDILALCTGKFYDNQFVSQIEENIVPVGDSQKYDEFDNFRSQESQENEPDNTSMCNDIDNVKDKDSINDSTGPKETDFIVLNASDNKENRTRNEDENLKSILDELADPEFDTPKPNKYFIGSLDARKDTVQNDSQIKKKFVIDSDDETNDVQVTDRKNRKKLKKKRPEKRALQISDDEEEISEQDESEEFETDIEEENPERLVEYDSEENEIELKPENPKKKRKMAEFFENEAELTSEDEWAGSGDEDEAGLDRMEREEGDDETFHQGQLQRELGQIHMRDVLDQDKREVRLIQELLFEDGDLGGGGRQRKFRWNNMDGGEETGTVPDEFADTQEEEFESEEQWRKQRHEREMFLRQMKNKGEPKESLNVSVNRTTIIKANLLSKTMSSLLMEVNSSTEKTETPVVTKKTAKDIPSPKKPFGLLQQSYQGSLLSRGHSALARLAALATPLAADDDAKVTTLGPTSRRNFVFATLTPDDKEPKVKKRKAESNPTTPKLVKIMRKDDKQNTSKSSLLDHFKA